MNNIYNNCLKVFSICAIVLFSSQMPARAEGGDELLDILRESMNEEFVKYSEKELPLYYMNYRAYDWSGMEINASMGSLAKSSEAKARFFTITTRVGNSEFDNYHVTKETPFNASSQIQLSLENTSKIIKGDIKRLLEDAYAAAQTDYNRRKSIVDMSPSNDMLHDFTEEVSATYYEAPYSEEEMKIDRLEWEERLKRISAIYKQYPDIFDGRATLWMTPIRKYFVSSEKSNIVENELLLRVSVTASTKDSDGNIVSLYKTWNLASVGQLPSEEEMKAETLKLIDRLNQLKNAPYAEPYSGPILFSNQAAGVFFHEIFGHRIEAHRFKLDSDGQTFKSKLGEIILPEDFSVYMDPTVKNYRGHDLFGSYQYDDEGVKGQRVTLIKDGKLNDFLYNRTPVDGNSKSNGHGRAVIGANAASRQSNLIVESSNLLSAKGIRKAFIDELKEQGKEFGYYVDEVSGGLAMIGRSLPNSFNVFPVITYKVYVDGRPDEMVRGLSIVGTPLSVFSNVIKAGEDKVDPFNGMCGAESGWLRVSAVSPQILVKQVETQKAEEGNEKPFIIARPMPVSK